MRFVSDDNEVVHAMGELGDDNLRIIFRLEVGHLNKRTRKTKTGSEQGSGFTRANERTVPDSGGTEPIVGAKESDELGDLDSSVVAEGTPGIFAGCDGVGVANQVEHHDGGEVNGGRDI